MAAGSAATCTTGVWNVERTISSPGPLLRTKKVSVDMAMTNEQDQCVMDADDGPHVEMQRMVDSVLLTPSPRCGDQRGFLQFTLQETALITTARRWSKE